MIYKGLNRIGMIGDIKTKGGGEIAEVYGGINESNPIYYKTRTLTGQAPLSYKALSKPLSDYLITGNTVQNGTPTPSDPVDVVGCGERTENLIDLDDFEIGLVNDATGGVNTGNTNYLTTNLRVFQAGTYTISLYNPYWQTAHNTSTRVCTYINGVFDGCVLNNDERDADYSASFTLDQDKQVRISVRKSDENVMLNTGSTALPYEPYGYKLPLTVNGTEYPIYLGQVPTTRRIKKLVLTGEEIWAYRTGEPPNVYFLEFAGAHFISNYGLCTHYHNQDSGSFNELADKHVIIRYSNDGTRSFIGIRDSSFSDATQFKSYLAAQYANGTPVTVWYVLATPETGIVNEPLMKIGDYADTISMAQAGVTIQTIAGANTLTVDTTVQPSVVSITGNIKEVQGT